MFASWKSQSTAVNAAELAVYSPPRQYDELSAATIATFDWLLAGMINLCAPQLAHVKFVVNVACSFMRAAQSNCMTIGP